MVDGDNRVCLSHPLSRRAVWLVGWLVCLVLAFTCGLAASWPASTTTGKKGWKDLLEDLVSRWSVESGRIESNK